MPQVARLPSRGEIRDLVARHSGELLAAAKRGDNTRHLSLDHIDKLKAYAALLPPEEAIAFLKMVAEESDSWAMHTEAQTDARARHAAAQEHRLATRLFLIVVAIAIGGGIWVWFHF